MLSEGGRHISSGAAAAVSVMFFAACRPELPEVVWAGEYLQYAASAGGPICRGSFYRQEAYVREIAASLGVNLTAKAFYAYVEPSEIEDYCLEQSENGCAYARKAFSVRATHLHELAHVVADFGGFVGPRPFAEGYAEMFGDGADLGRERLPIETVLSDFVVDDAHYYTAGLFARFLVERHGLDLFVEFLRTAGDLDADFAQFSPRYQQVFGEPIEVAMSEFVDYPSCSELSNRIAVVDCNLPLEAWADDAITLRANLDCSLDDVMGPSLGKQPIIWTSRGFSVDTPGPYVALAAANPEGWGGIRLIKCGSCWDDFDLTLQPGDEAYPELDVGRYYVLFARHLDDPGELSLALGRL